MAARVASAICSMTGFGVRAGANNPMKFCEIMPGNPGLDRGRDVGRRREPLGRRDRENAHFPERCSSIIWAVMFGTASGICPLMRSVIAGPAPLYGTCTMSGVPASFLNNSPVSWFTEPTPAEP